MSTTYFDARQALYTLIDGIDVTSVIVGGWGEKHRHLPKDVRLYPAFAVTPIRDEETTLDAISDEDRVTLGVQIIDTWLDASEGDDRLSRLIDLVRTAVRQQKRSMNPIGGTAYTLGRIFGEWGADDGRGERWYTLNVELKVDQSLLP